MRGLTRLRRLVRRNDADSRNAGITDEDRLYLKAGWDDRIPVPAEAAAELVPANPRLAQLRRQYDALDLPALARSRWDEPAVAAWLDLQWFRGESLFVWHYRELPRITQLKYFIYARYVRDRDALGLLDRLCEDGAFGCWTFTYPNWGRVSRDLLQSVNEISFLERQLAISERPQLSVLDIGAGYGRLAHRMASALPNLNDYCCVDAIPEATFISEWYLRFRGVSPPARVVPLDRVESDLRPGCFDLAVNINSFSECPLEAVSWWIELLARLDVPNLLIVPNEPNGFLSSEPDGTKRDLAPLLSAVGYSLTTREPVIDDAAVRELLPLEDRFHLYCLR